ncbi:sporulation protein [Ammoniphilus sp. CFH 90114]|uniref:sporulation protein n=1 Tax=Ammoniphilus sp. CFH 90114 TaxID=2493665 RepID=UPI00100F6FBF|nr:sporulation protein [Ammoniphilus sp. CFH 90114]RXT03871.1 sporulation protein SpoOM [Ammoniphilus sp. CFH 90114]
MFKKFMAKLGVGSAKIDFVLSKQQYELGGLVEGEFRIEGGAVEQEINKVGVDFNLKMNIKGKEFSHVVAHIPVSSSFMIHANERKILPFTYQLPNNLLISRGPISYSFITRLDIAAGVDNLDQDYITILPPASFQQLVEALGLLGFREKMDSGKFDGYSQEFEFFPTTYFKSQLSELEFTVAIEEEGLRLLLELDLMTGFGLGEKELKREIFFTNEELKDVQNLSSQLQSIIEEMIQNPQQYPASMYNGHASGGHHRRGGGLAGAMGGFAAGMLGGMLLDDLLFGDEETEAASGDEGFDFFGGDDDEF